MKVKPAKRATAAHKSTLLGWYVSSDGSPPAGYHRLLDAPEVCACINRMAAVAGSATIYLMRSAKGGDKREKTALSRFVDVTPCPGMTRQVWMTWIVATLLGSGDGNAFCKPILRGGELAALRPMPRASMIETDNDELYRVSWRGGTYDADTVLHFRLFSDPVCPWRGRGYRLQAEAVAKRLQQSDSIRATLSSPDYKPPIVISVDSDADLHGREGREQFRKDYLEDNEPGQPWILPSGLVKVQQIKPLTLADLAIKDTVELDKKTVAAIFGVPLFLLGIGSYNEAEYNAFIKTVIEPICVGIEQELTSKLLSSDQMYFQFNRRRLYNYDLKSLVDMDLAMSDRGYLNGDEVREDAYRDPAGLTEYRPLENYIPWDKAGDQKKLKDKEDKDHAENDSAED